MLDFQHNAAELEAAGVKVVLVSTDTEENARATTEGYDITFIVGYGLEGAAVSDLTGGFYDAEGGFLHAMGFLLAPDGKIVTAVYSTGSLGRLVARDVLELVKHMSERKQG